MKTDEPTRAPKASSLKDKALAAKARAKKGQSDDTPETKQEKLLNRRGDDKPDKAR